MVILTVFINSLIVLIMAGVVWFFFGHRIRRWLDL